MVDVDPAVTSHYKFKTKLVDHIIDDNFETLTSMRMGIEVDLNDNLDYAAACKVLFGRHVNSDIISDCYSSLVFTVRNLQVFSYQQLAYNTIMAATGA